MPSEMFGAPLGVIAFDQNERANALNAVQVQEALGRVAMQPGQQRKAEAEAEKLELELQQERRWAEMLQKQAVGEGPTSVPRSMAEQLDFLAESAMSAGLVTKGSTLAKSAAELRTKESAAANNSARRAKSLLEAQRARVELDGQILGSADSPEAWARANALYQFQTGAPSPYAAIPYSPAVVKQIRDASLSAKEELDLEEKKLTRLETEAYRTRRLGQHDTAQRLREIRAEIAAAREARLAKVGGKPPGSPARGDLDQAKRIIKKDFGEDGLEPADLNDAAFNISADAKARMRLNPALNISEALQQAYNAARASGDFTESKGTLGFGKKAKFLGGGKSPETALKLPEKPKAGELKNGRYYVSPSGLVGKWTGKGFVVTGGGRALSGHNERKNDEESEEEEEE